MPDFLTVYVVAWVLLLWFGTGLVIYRWGPGRMRARVACPEKLRRADLVVLFREPIWGSLKPSDVLACSLLGSASVDCGKGCMSQL